MRRSKVRYWSTECLHTAPWVFSINQMRKRRRKEILAISKLLMPSLPIACNLWRLTLSTTTSLSSNSSQWMSWSWRSRRNGQINRSQDLWCWQWSSPWSNLSWWGSETLKLQPLSSGLSWSSNSLTKPWTWKSGLRELSSGWRARMIYWSWCLNRLKIN